jgi:hypothetical protein
MMDGERVSPAVQQAADNLGRARRHAITTERVAVMVFTMSVVAALGALTAGIEYVGLAVWSLLGGAAIWSLLRAVALRLHLLVDQTMIEGDED